MAGQEGACGMIEADLKPVRPLSREQRLIADLRHQNALLMERNSVLLRRVAWYEAHTGYRFCRFYV